jgi:hypothetical protein
MRVDLASGARTEIASGLNRASGLAIEPGGANALVTDCGTAGSNNCNSNGRLLRVNLAGGVAVVTQGLADPRGIFVEDGGATALVVEYNSGRLLRVDLQSGGFAIVATGLDDPTQVFGEAGGATALVAVQNSLVRVDLSDGAFERLYHWPSETFVVESGGATALVAGRDYGLGASLVRVDLMTGALNVLLPGLFNRVETLVLDTTGTTGFYTEEKGKTGNILQFTVPLW